MYARIIYFYFLIPLLVKLLLMILLPLVLGECHSRYLHAPCGIYLTVHTCLSIIASKIYTYTHIYIYIYIYIYKYAYCFLFCLFVRQLEPARCWLSESFDELIYKESFEQSRSKSSPLEQTRSKLANPVELTGFDRG